MHIHSLIHTLNQSLTHPLTYLPTRSLSLPHSLTPSPIHSITPSPIHLLNHSLTHPLTHSPIHSLTQSLPHPSTYSITHSPIHSYSLTHPPTHTLSLTHSLTHSLFSHSLTRSFSLSLSLDWIPGLPVDPAVYWLYMLQLGFYIHCVYASVFLETIRRDIVLLMLHHFITLALLGYSYAVR